MTLFNNVCRQEENCVERQLAIRQLTLKENSRVSWFIALKNILYKFELPPPLELLENPPAKLHWKKIVKQPYTNTVKSKFGQDIPLYTSLRYFKCLDYTPGACHDILSVKGDPIRETQKLSVKVKLLIHTYVFQAKKVEFSETEKSALCKPCSIEKEDLENLHADRTTVCFEP